MNFQHRTTKYKVGVIESVDSGYLIIPLKHSTFEREHFKIA